MSNARKAILDVLEKWERGQMSATEVWKWSLDVHDTGKLDFDDETPDGHSAAEEVLAHLDLLETNFVTPEDIPAMRRLLGSTPDTFAAELSAFVDYVDGVDYDARIEQLRKIPPYDQAFKTFGDDIPID